MTAIKYVDSNFSTAVMDITDHLISGFRPIDIKVSHSTVYNFMRAGWNLLKSRAPLS